MGNNFNGELGFGKATRPLKNPVVNEFFMAKKEMIETISAGLAHSIARSKLGYVYSWGDNKYGQVSAEAVRFFPTPRLVEIDKQKVKALQAVAGLRANYILLSSFQIMGIGTSSSFNSPRNSDYTIIDLLHVKMLIIKDNQHELEKLGSDKVVL